MISKSGRTMGGFQSKKCSNNAKLQKFWFQKPYPTAVIAKIVPKCGLYKHRTIDDLRREIYSALVKMDAHRSLMRIYEVRETSTSFIVIMERMYGQDLFEFLTTNQKTILSEEQIKYMIKQILLGLKHLHSHGILHRDIKPENIMLRNAPNSTSKISLHELQLALIDFDSCKLMHPTASAIVNELPPAYLLVGTPAYMPPEVLFNNSVDASADLWGVGILLYIFVTRRFPVDMRTVKTPKAAMETLRKLASIGFDFTHSEFDQIPFARHLCSRLLCFDISKRILTVAEALKHPWFSDEPFKECLNWHSKGFESTLFTDVTDESTCCCDLEEKAERLAVNAYSPIIPIDVYD